MSADVLFNYINLIITSGNNLALMHKMEIPDKKRDASQFYKLSKKQFSDLDNELILLLKGDTSYKKREVRG